MSAGASHWFMWLLRVCSPIKVVSLWAHIVQFDRFVHMIARFVQVFRLTVFETEHVSGRNFWPGLREGDAVDREDRDYYTQGEGTECDADEEPHADGVSCSTCNEYYT